MARSGPTELAYWKDGSSAHREAVRSKLTPNAVRLFLFSDGIGATNAIIRHRNLTLFAPATMVA